MITFHNIFDKRRRKNNGIIDESAKESDKHENTWLYKLLEIRNSLLLSVIGSIRITNDFYYD